MVLLISFFLPEQNAAIFSGMRSGKRKTMPENNVHILAG